MISTGSPSPHPYFRSAISNLVPQLAICVTVEHPRGRANLRVSDPDHNIGIAPDILDPPGGITRFGEQIETMAADHKSDLDFARQPCSTPDRGQIKDLLVRKILDIGPHH